MDQSREKERRRNLKCFDQTKERRDLSWGEVRDENAHRGDVLEDVLKRELVLGFKEDGRGRRIRVWDDQKELFKLDRSFVCVSSTDVALRQIEARLLEIEVKRLEDVEGSHQTVDQSGRSDVWTFKLDVVEKEGNECREIGGPRKDFDCVAVGRMGLSVHNHLEPF